MLSYRKRLSEGVKRRIIELKQQGIETAVISERLGVPAPTINYLLRKGRREK